jgi:histidine transport system permease protein
MIELLQEYWRPFLYSDGQNITGLAMTMWLLSASIFIGFIVSIPLSIARVSPHFWFAGRCSSTPTCSGARRSISSC